MRVLRKPAHLVSGMLLFSLFAAGGAQAAALSPAAKAAAPQVATGPAQIPAEWSAIAPAGTCVANPWSASCGRNPKSVSYPSPNDLDKLTQALSVQRVFGDSSTSVEPPNDLPPTVVQTPPLAHAPAAAATAGAAQPNVGVINCNLNIGAPQVYSHSGDYAISANSVSSCPVGFVYTEVNVGIHRDNQPLAGPDIYSHDNGTTYASATSSYDCNHINFYEYENSTLSYSEFSDGQATSGSGTARSTHSCPG